MENGRRYPVGGDSSERGIRFCTNGERRSSGVSDQPFSGYDRGIMYRSETSIIMLPGLGMDARMLQPQSSYFPNSYVLKLPPAKNAASLAAYASELVSEWPKQLPVLTVGPGHNGGKFFLAGVAFGGMLALEIALQVAQLASVQLSDDTQGTEYSAHLSRSSR